MKNRILKIFMGSCLTLVLLGIVAYLQIAFQRADIKTAIRLVAEAQVSGKPLSWKIESVIPARQKECQVKVVSKFYGHMEVTCKDSRDPRKELHWLVNIIDGMVKPSNDAAIRLGRGEPPW